MGIRFLHLRVLLFPELFCLPKVGYTSFLVSQPAMKGGYMFHMNVLFQYMYMLHVVEAKCY